MCLSIVPYLTGHQEKVAFMMKRWLLLIYMLVLAVAPGFSDPGSAHRVYVRVVQRIASVRTSLSNMDEYLVQIKSKSGNAFTAKMIDEYPAYARALPIASLQDGVPFSVSLRRMPTCDDHASGLNGSGLRCFSMVHGSWRLPKDATEDRWWK